MEIKEFRSQEMRRLSGKLLFEKMLTELKDYGVVNDFKYVEKGSVDWRKGIHYWVDTDHGQVPMAFFLKFSEAKKKRSNLPLTTVSLRSPNNGLFKQNEDMLVDISKKTVNYLIAHEMISPAKVLGNMVGK